MLKDELELVRVHAREIAKEELALVVPKKAARDEAAWKELARLASATDKMFNDINELSAVVKALSSENVGKNKETKIKGGK